MTKISIIIPVYNADVYLNDCIDSIVDQNPKYIEVIIINDGSIDNSGAIADSYAQNYDYIRVIHQENHGVSSARNHALSYAVGKYIAFVDADDMVYSDFFDNILYLIKKSHADIIEFNADLIDEKSKIYNTSIFSIKKSLSHKKNIKQAKKYLSKEAKYYLWARVIKRGMIDELKFNEKIGFCEDALYLTECYFRAQSILTINKALYQYRKHQTNVTATNTPNNISQLSVVCDIINKKIIRGIENNDKNYVDSYLVLLINMVHLRKSMYALHYKSIACDRVTLTNIQKIKKYSEWSWLKSESNVHWLRRLSILAPKSSNILILLKNYLKCK